MAPAPDPKRLHELSDSLPTALSRALDDFAAQAPNAGDLEAVSSALSALGLPIALPSTAPAAPLDLASTKLAAGVREIITGAGPAASAATLSVGAVAAALLRQGSPQGAHRIPHDGDLRLGRARDRVRTRDSLSARRLGAALSARKARNPGFGRLAFVP